MYASSFVVLVAGCGGSRCEDLGDTDKRDWCFHEAAIQQAAGGDMEGAKGHLAKIEAPMVKAFATEKILTAASGALTQQQAEGMCRDLAAPYSDNCLRTWSRPHLWGGAK